MAQELEITLESKPESVGMARRVAAEVIDGLNEQTLEDVRLIISELVTNAVKHGPDGRVKVHLRRDGRTVRGAVEDEGTGPFRHRPEVRPGPIGGLGLHLVDRLSDRWGVDSSSARVWFELKDHHSA